MARTAILVDGNYYLHRARMLWGRIKAPEERAAELHSYAIKHITIRRDKKLEYGERSLYRIFYYDCPPLDRGSVKQPWSTHNTVFSKKHSSNIWSSDFQRSLGRMRKVAMRMGTLKTSGLHYNLKEESLKRLLAGDIAVGDLGESDYTLVGLKQSGVDMRIGLDVASLASARIVDQIILMAGDTDFIPVAKVARRAGVDFILDPMGRKPSPDLELQVDGIEDLT
ncbi:NYN domain-containing protein [Olsenella uli]|mgnify:CR=1 FL=1|uniref:NYN domain-containing protein n=1 Tax=Olsenella uli TaxID=133926 RepID=UPI00044DFD53|nr:NYN domain-containing protein [Olsenella uli]EUB32648.1 NYN domain protein [Olsenella uli MSTE5]